MIGKIQRVPLRKVTQHEAHDFTTWLVDNIDVLNDAIDLNLTEARREQSVGSFNVDIEAEDENSGDKVVIENQLGKSDHDHLGKLITYLSNLDAKIAIWITPEPRSEHISAVNWLNESNLARFYLLKVEAIKIGESRPAFWFTEIVGPSEEARKIGEVKEKDLERFGVRRKFWTSLLERAKDQTSLHSNITPGKYSWIGTGSGLRGLTYNYAVKQDEAKVELYIDRGKGCEEDNEVLFEQLIKNKSDIEKKFGGKLDWERLENRRACRIVKDIKSGGYRSEEADWPKVQDQMIEAMIKLEKALKPHVKKLEIRSDSSLEKAA